VLKRYFRWTEAIATAPRVRRLGPPELARGLFRGFLLAGLLILFFGKLAEDVVSNEIYTFDEVTTHFIRQYTSPPVTSAMKAFTSLGSPGAVFIIATGVIAALLFLRRPLLEPLFIATATTGSLFIDELLKWVFHRPRPDLNQLVNAAGYSFPSGHSTVSIAFYGSIAYLLWTYLPRIPIRWLITGCLVLLVFFIGISRVYLGVHFPSDVIGGFTAGGIWLAGCVIARHFVVYRRLNKPQVQ